MTELTFLIILFISTFFGAFAGTLMGIKIVEWLDYRRFCKAFEPLIGRVKE